ncbi:MAG TPA: formate--tetrahydrofolate ligase [Gemmatimonadota bacterium]|nr:formate--tetrahydrofolate ligase [Gemmatimonadota bacterium]
MKSDIEIARSVELRPIADIAGDLGLEAAEIEPYGRHMAKVRLAALDRRASRGRLVLVSGISPTPAGEGKSTVSVGLAQALVRRGKRAVLCLREPSLGPCMGIKGGAAGGGWSQVLPMEEINLHFTGDIHAVGAATNLLAALLDNHLHHGNALGIDPRQVLWKRVLDMNDRALRNIVVGLGGKAQGVPREDGFQITVASEVMAILCLAEGIEDLERRLSQIVVGYTYADDPVRASDLEAQGAMTLLLRKAIEPNLVQTLEGGAAFVHGGPFANIAHGCNSLLATRMGLATGEYCVTEAGFGTDLGAEKFFDIKCRYGGLEPSAAVVVATARALKYNGGASRRGVQAPNPEALERGLPNLAAHLDILSRFGMSPIVALNEFAGDAEVELRRIETFCEERGVAVARARVHAEGGAGGLELADRVISTAEAMSPGSFRFLYPLEMAIRDKIATIAREVYGADGVEYTRPAERDIERLEQIGLGTLPVCIAKTQYSLSDDPARLGRPRGFHVTVNQVRPSAGAGFLVVLTGDIMTMPGLPKKPAAEGMRVDPDGTVHGLF